MKIIYQIWWYSACAFLFLVVLLAAWLSRKNMVRSRILSSARQEINKNIFQNSKWKIWLTYCSDHLGEFHLSVQRELNEMVPFVVPICLTWLFHRIETQEVRILDKVWTGQNSSMSFEFRSERSQDSLTITSKPFERMFCVVAMQKKKSKIFEFKKMTYQDDILTDESKAEVTCHEIRFHHFNLYFHLFPISSEN